MKVKHKILRLDLQKSCLLVMSVHYFPRDSCAQALVTGLGLRARGLSVSDCSLDEILVQKIVTNICLKRLFSKIFLIYCIPSHHLLYREKNLSENSSHRIRFFHSEYSEF